MDFTTIWNNIRRCEGQTFATLRGHAFSYQVCEHGLAIKRSEMMLPKCDIEAASRNFSPYGGKACRGADAYIHALLRDGRIHG